MWAVLLTASLNFKNYALHKYDSITLYHIILSKPLHLFKFRYKNAQTESIFKVFHSGTEYRTESFIVWKLPWVRFWDCANDCEYDLRVSTSQLCIFDHLKWNDHLNRLQMIIWKKNYAEKNYELRKIMSWEKDHSIQHIDFGILWLRDQYGMWRYNSIQMLSSVTGKSLNSIQTSCAAAPKIPHDLEMQSFQSEPDHKCIAWLLIICSTCTVL